MTTIKTSYIVMAVIAVLVLAGLAMLAMRNTEPSNTVVDLTDTTVTPTEGLPTGTETVSPTGPTGTTGAMGNQATVTLTAQNSSGQTGTATLVESNGQTVVTLNIVPRDTTTAQPAHIHAGSCPNPGAVRYPLTNVVNGRSVTTVAATLAQLRAQLPLAINVHQSATQSSVYVSCGDLSL